MPQEHKTMKQLPVTERPYEKLERNGAGSLTDAELLAIIIRAGTREESSVEVARRILDAHPVYKGLLGICHLSGTELSKLPGIGRVKAIQLAAVAELSKRIAAYTAGDCVHFNSPQAFVSRYMEQMRHLDTEEVRVVMLNSKCRFINDKVISTGTVNSSVISPREVFLEALSQSAVFIVLLHNHPSGDPSPSKEDLAVTVQIKNAGELIGIGLLDHIIIGDHRYISLKEEGLL